MSFGVGISDILHILKLAKDTVQSCRSAPAVFAEASRVLESLVQLLEAVETEYKKPESPLHCDERTRTDFAIHFKNCQTSTEPLAEYIAKYASLGTTQINLADRLRFSKKNYVELRQNLAFYTARLSEFLQMTGLGALGRIEKKLGDVHDFLPQVMDKLDQLCAEQRIMEDKESLLSDHPGDQKHVWKAFRSQLLRAGYNSTVLQQHQAEIFLRIRELIGIGALESHVTKLIHPYDEPLEDETTVYSLPRRSRTALDESDSDQEFYKTPIRQRSRNSLRTKRSSGSIGSTRRLTSPRGRQLRSRTSDDSLYLGSSSNSSHSPERRPTRNLERRATVAGEISQAKGQSEPANRLNDRLEPRLWRNPRGDAIEKGTFVCVDADLVVLRDLAGDEMRIPLKNLSRADAAFVREAQEQRVSTARAAVSVSGDTCRRASPKDSCLSERKSRTDGLVKRRDKYHDEDTDTIDLPRRTKPEILVGRRTKPVLKWQYRTQIDTKYVFNGGNCNSDALPNAAAAGNLEKVKSLLRSGAYLEAIGPKSWTETTTSTDSEGNTTTSSIRHSFPETTALYRSAYAGHFHVARWLLGHSANVNTRDGYDGTVGELILYKAIRNGYRDIVQLLLEYGATQTELTSGGLNALRLSCSYPRSSIVKLLLDHGATINLASPRTKETALHLASANGFATSVKLLLAESAQPNTLNHLGASPIYKACGRGHALSVRHLLQYGADPSRGRGRQGETAFYRAAWANHLDVVEHLLDFDADVNIRNDKAMRAYKDMTEKVMHAVVAGLGQNHAFMNAWAKMPLHAAAYQGHRGMVRLLVEAGAEMEAVGNDEMTPLYLAARQGHEGVVRWLLREGAKLETERHDPVLALIGEANSRRGGRGKGGGGKELTALEEHKKNMAKAGTGDFVVGLMAEIVGGMSRSRRGTL